MNAPTQDLHALKEKLRATWAAGDYGVIARGLEQSAREFLSRAAIAPDERVLDVACGAGQLAVPAAKAGARATGIDIAENLIAQARAEAEAEGLEIRFDVGDAEEMPYADATFDVVISLIGVMFAPRPERATSEMLRVCRPGGRIVMGNWTPEGFVGEFFRTVARHAPPPDMPSPLLWGDEAVVEERLGGGVSELRMERRTLRFRYPMPPSALAVHYLDYFGPTKRAAATLDADGREALRDDLERLWSGNNDAAQEGTQVDAEILEIVAVR